MNTFEKLISVKSIVLTIASITIVCLSLMTTEVTVVAATNNVEENKGSSKVIGQNSSLYQLNMIVMPDNAGMVNIIPAKETFDQDEIVQVLALPNGINGQRNGNVHIEAETGTINGNFAVRLETSASSKFHLYGTIGGPKDGASKYSFSIAESGNYYIWGRCYALSPTEDSFFMAVDGSTDTLTWHLNENYNTWEWQRVSHNRVEQQFALGDGQHELTVIKRDLNAQIDKLIITKDANFQPQGKEELPLGEIFYQFDYWGGDLGGLDNPREVTMNSNKDGIAYFYIEGDEVVNTPQPLTGPNEGEVGESLDFATGGSVSNFGDLVEYQFDWGDGQQTIWGDSTGSHIFEHVGTYQVKARARCQTHSNIVSDWAEAHDVTITGATSIFQLLVDVYPENTGRVFINPQKDRYDQDEMVQLSALSNDVNGELDGNVYIEAETGLLDGNIGVGVDTAASTGFYIYGKEGIAKDGSAEYSFEINEAGDYKIWGRCFALSGSEDSFFLFIDDEQDTLTWHLNEDFYNEWKWQTVSHDRLEQVFPLDVGTHKIVFIKRDQNSRLDKMILTKDPVFEPVGKEEFEQQDAYIFDHWSGDINSPDNPVDVRMDGNKSVTANFVFTGEETVTTPNTPSGTDSGYVGNAFSFSTGGSKSNHGFGVEYKFDWGDGSFSDWGSPNQEHTYNQVNSFEVKTKARSLSGLETESEWSSPFIIYIVEEPVVLFTLNIDIEPAGKGSVIKMPGKIQYTPGDTVTLYPVPVSDYFFDFWSGDLAGNVNPGKVIMSSNKTITAHFATITEEVSVPSTPTGADSGIIGLSLSFSTGGATCNFGHNVEYQFDWGDGTLSDWGSTTRIHTFSYADTLKISARARCQVNNNIISELSVTHSVIIVESYLYTITILIEPPGTGSVNKTPPKAEYENNETVILSPLPIANYMFDRWGGDLTGTNYPAMITMDGNKVITAYFKFPSTVESERDIKPDKFALFQNYPNPFNPETTISYQVPENCFVSLTIYNMKGQTIKNLVDEYKHAGMYSITWNALDLFNNFVPSGIYLYRISTAKFKQQNKMILLK
jgi:hypothetical protein